MNNAAKLSCTVIVFDIKDKTALGFVQDMRASKSVTVDFVHVMNDVGMVVMRFTRNKVIGNYKTDAYRTVNAALRKNGSDAPRSFYDFVREDITNRA